MWLEVMRLGDGSEDGMDYVWAEGGRDSNFCWHH